MVNNQVVVQYHGTVHRLVANVGCGDLKLVVVENYEAKIGGDKRAVVAGESYIVDCFGNGDVGVLNVADIAHVTTLYINHINVRVEISNHNIFLVLIEVDVLHSRVVKVIGAVKMLVLLRLLVVAVKVATGKVINLVAGVDAVGYVLAGKDGVQCPASKVVLCLCSECHKCNYQCDDMFHCLVVRLVV